MSFVHFVTLLVGFVTGEWTVDGGARDESRRWNSVIAIGLHECGLDRGIAGREFCRACHALARPPSNRLA